MLHMQPMSGNTVAHAATLCQLICTVLCLTYEQGLSLEPNVAPGLSAYRPLTYDILCCFSRCCAIDL